jgi:hypothetical protein
MTNTYPDDAQMEVKRYEEMRCIRCVLERILRALDEGLFVDYQMEKFGKAKLQEKQMEPELEMMKWDFMKDEVGDLPEE